MYRKLILLCFLFLSVFFLGGCTLVEENDNGYDDVLMSDIKDVVVEKSKGEGLEYENINVSKSEDSPNFKWLNDEGYIELIDKGDFLFMTYSERSPEREKLDAILSEVENVLKSEGFYTNEENSSEDFVYAYERDDGELYSLDVGTPSSFSISNGNIENAKEESSTYQEILNAYFDEYIPGTDINVARKEDDFALINIVVSIGGGRAIFQEKGGEWVEVYPFTNDIWFCDTLLEAEVPPELLKDSESDEVRCFSEEESVEKDYIYYYKENS